MRVFILGATGQIGSAIADELLAHDYSVVALARSDETEHALTAKGADVVRGDLLDPTPWQAVIHDVDAIIHAAATFGDNMGDVDNRLVQSLIKEGKKTGKSSRFIFTGGCWLYGETGDAVATEKSPFDPIPSFAWMIENGKAVMEADCFEGIVIHPAMVYFRDGGVISRFINSAEKAGRVEVWGSLNTRWPVVHQKDLAVAYRLALEKGQPGEHYNVASEEGVMVADMVDVIGQRFAITTEPFVRNVSDVIAEQGDWAAGPALDQQMSGAKAMSELGWRPTVTDMISNIR